MKPFLHHQDFLMLFCSFILVYWFNNNCQTCDNLKGRKREAAWPPDTEDKNSFPKQLTLCIGRQYYVNDTKKKNSVVKWNFTECHYDRISLKRMLNKIRKITC